MPLPARPLFLLCQAAPTFRSQCRTQAMNDVRENVAVRQVFNNAFTVALGLANGTQPRRPEPDRP